MRTLGPLAQSGPGTAVHAECCFADQPSLGHGPPRPNTLDRAGLRGDTASRSAARCRLTPNSGDGMNFPSAVAWAEHGLDPAFASSDVPRSTAATAAALPYLIQIDGVAQPVVRLLHRSSWATWRSASCMLAWAACACFVRRRKTLVVAAFVCPGGSALDRATVAHSLGDRGPMWGIALAIVWQWIAPRGPTCAARRCRDALDV